MAPCFLCDRTDRGGAVCLVYCTVEHRVLGHVVVDSSINGHTKEKKSPRRTRSSTRLRARILQLRNRRHRRRKTAKNKVCYTYFLCFSNVLWCLCTDSVLRVGKYSLAFLSTLTAANQSANLNAKLFVLFKFPVACRPSYIKYKCS